MTFQLTLPEKMKGKEVDYTWALDPLVLETGKLPNPCFPGELTRKLSVNITSDSVSIAKKKGGSILSGQIFGPINVEESTWTLEDNVRLVIIFEKKTELIWKTVFKGDPEIDVSKVDNSKKLEEFDNDTQGALRKVVYEQKRKRMGLPTTEEEKQIEMLKKAWDAEGSPFKGQPFDPSKFNIPSGQTPFMPPPSK